MGNLRGEKYQADGPNERQAMLLLHLSRCA